MTAADFREIPPANVGGDKQDAFELFARDFLVALGYEVEEEPSRGPDGGKDLIVLEPLSGILVNEKKRWVVSCKHHAHSGRAVSDSDEINIPGRVGKFRAEGFMAFYSTIPSSALADTFKHHKDDFSIAVLDGGYIEGKLVSAPSLQSIFERYFPRSYRLWRSQAKMPAQIWASYTPLECTVCGKDLLIDRSGVTAIAVRSDAPTSVLDFYWACYGDCDRTLQERAWTNWEAITKWESLADLSIPLVYVRWIGTYLTRLREGVYTFTDEAFERFRHFTLCMAQLVVRETAPEQWERMKDLVTIPTVLGGLGQ